jgi:hypothetical protein
MKTDAELEQIFRHTSGSSLTAALRAIYHEGYEAAVKKVAAKPDGDALKVKRAYTKKAVKKSKK